MKTVVLKFGGTSVGSLERIKKVAKIIATYKKMRFKVGNMKLNKMKTVTYVQPTPKIIKEIKNFNIKNEALFPKYLPMLMPPRKWTSPFIGGYYGKKHNFENKPEEIANALQSSKSK